MTVTMSHLIWNTEVTIFLIIWYVFDSILNIFVIFISVSQSNRSHLSLLPSHQLLKQQQLFHQPLLRQKKCHQVWLLKYHLSLMTI